jgi:hypothetical protein
MSSSLSLPEMAASEIRKLDIWKINVDETVRIRDNDLDGSVEIFCSFLNLWNTIIFGLQHPH